MWVNAVCHHTVSAKRPKINKTHKINYAVEKLIRIILKGNRHCIILVSMAPNIVKQTENSLLVLFIHCGNVKWELSSLGMAIDKSDILISLSFSRS